MVEIIFLYFFFFNFQVIVSGNDLGEPSLSSTAQVIINVVRNNYAPEFTPPQYAQNINYNKAINDVIERLTARDRDTDVSIHVCNSSLLYNYNISTDKC